MAADYGTLVAVSYPPYLASRDAAEIAMGGAAGERYQAHVAFQDGNDTIVVAAYTNSSFGRVRAFVLDANGAVRRIDEPDLTLHGTYPEVQLIELDGSAPAEPVVSIEDDRGSGAWIFSWRGGALRCISARGQDPDDASISSPKFIDLDGDGAMEIIERSPSTSDDGEPALVHTLYRLENGSYGAGRDVSLWTSVARRRGAPDLFTEDFRSGGTKGTLLVLNGDTHAARATSARIELNGVTIVDPSQLNPKVERITRSVSLAPENTLSVRLAGQPGVRVSLLIIDDE